MLSVIVPNYNKEKYIEKCILSILQQSYRDIEIIIVDDCSSDGSLACVKGLMRSYSNIRLIDLKENKGVSNARNVGFKSAKGEYITTIDSDDFYYNPQKLENEMNLLKDCEKAGIAAIVYSKLVSVDENGEVMPSIPQAPDENYPTGNILYRLLTDKDVFSIIPRDYCMSKKSFFEIDGYDTKSKLYEDFDVLLQLATKFRFFCTYDNGTAYRHTFKGLSQRNYNLLRLKPFIIKMKYLGYLPPNMRMKAKSLVYCQYFLTRARLKLRPYLKRGLAKNL